MNQNESLDIGRVALSPSSSQDNAVIRAVSVPGSETDNTISNTEESLLPSKNSETKDNMVVDMEAVKSANATAYNGDEGTPEAQAGVKNMEAITMSWTKWGLIIAYARFVSKIALPNFWEGEY